MAPNILEKISIKGQFYPHTPEKTRLVVEHAQYGFVDKEGVIHLLTSDPEDIWNMVPVIKYQDIIRE